MVLSQGWMRAGVVVMSCVVISVAGCDDRSAQKQAATPAKPDAPEAAAAVERAVADAQAIEATLKTAARAKTEGQETPACCEEHTPKSESVAKSDGDAAKPTDAPATPATPAKPGKLRASEWTEPAKRQAFLLDFNVTNQDGQMLQLSELVGTPMAVSFFFTRCPQPNMCPLITSTMTQLQRKVEQAGLSEKVRLILISYDPGYDTPSRLQKYAEGYGFKFDNGMMLRPKTEEYMALLGEMGIDIAPEPDGNIGHFIELILIDRKGRYVRDYTGAIWDNDAVLADLRTLAAETE